MLIVELLFAFVNIGSGTTQILNVEQQCTIETHNA